MGEAPEGAGASPRIYRAMPTVIAFWAGLCLGSFINVLIYRLPRDQSIVSPRSRCPRCGKMIAWYDNIPVLSWLYLRGRCRRCKAGISARYPAVELTMGLLAVALWRHGESDPIWAALSIAVAGVFLAITMIDWDTFLIPDELSLGLLIAGLPASLVNPFFAGWAWYGRLGWSVLGAAAGLAISWATAVFGEKLFRKEALGGGDIKLLAAVGAWTGALGAFDCLIVASFLGSVYGVALMLRGKLKRSDPIPFGPFLCAAALFNFFWLLPFGFPFIGLTAELPH